MALKLQQPGSPDALTLTPGRPAIIVVDWKAMCTPASRHAFDHYRAQVTPSRRGPAPRRRTDRADDLRRRHPGPADDADQAKGG